MNRTSHVPELRPVSAFEDVTIPAERTFGFYLITVGYEQSWMIRGSHHTAKRIARGRTQYGEAQLSFLEAIDTPALELELPDTGATHGPQTRNRHSACRL